MLDPRRSSSPLLRSIAYYLVSRPSMADRIPTVLQTLIVKNGKISSLAFSVIYLIFISVWFPFYLLTFLVGEWGVYFLSTATVFYVGRAIIRLIAFPGASQRVTAEIEREFAKYSVRMLEHSVNCIAELTVALKQQQMRNSGATGYGRTENIPGIWKRARMYRNRVLAVYKDVLAHLYRMPPDTSSVHAVASPDVTPYGNNRLVGDIGSLSGLTPEARTQGLELYNKLKGIVRMLDDLERAAKQTLSPNSSSSSFMGSSPQPLSEESFAITQKLEPALKDLQDFLGALRQSTRADEDEDDENEEGITVDAMRRKFEGRTKSSWDAIQNGLSSFMTMIDPPPHSSIFGLDAQRGCLMSRYRGCKQFWVRRPTGGMIDVLHFPAVKDGQVIQGNEKAVLYCNPNAGLIEVAAGMSLVGGNVPSVDEESASEENSWADFYTSKGYDLYVYNYAGYGRSFGTTLCVSGPGSEAYSSGTLARLGRIFRSCFLAFQPTPYTLRADGQAVATHLISDDTIQRLFIHGESIGGVAASATARVLSQNPSTRAKMSLLLCDRTFCNLEATAQRLVGGWSGFAIRILAPFWSTDVAGDYIAASCPKVIASDPADAIIADAASLKAGVALWKELKRGSMDTERVGWMSDTPLQYRMADWENACVTDSRYLPVGSLFRAKPPVWPNDKHVSLEEAFHFAACCRRIGKMAKASPLSSTIDAGEDGIEYNDSLGAISTQAPMAIEAWKTLACCDGLTGAPLVFAIKRGFDTTVTWLCSTLVFGCQRIVAAAESKNGEGSPVDAHDFDLRPKGYEAKEAEGVMHPKPIPEVLNVLISIMENGDESISARKYSVLYCPSRRKILTSPRQFRTSFLTS